MNQLLASVLPLSLGAMVSPTVLTAVVLVLSGKVSPRARAWAFVGGATAILAAITVSAPVMARAFARVNPRVLYGFDAGLGVLLFALGVWTLVRPKQTAEKKAPKPTEPKPHLPEYALFGVVMIGTDFSSLVLYIAAMKEIAKAHLILGEQVAIVLIPFVAVLLPALVPAIVGSVAPRASERLLAPVAGWVGKYSKPITVVISLVFGVYLMAKGIPPLLR